jgi:hypothetical protein
VASERYNSTSRTAVVRAPSNSHVFFFLSLYFSHNRVFLGCFICAVEIILRLLGYHASRTSLYFDMRFSKDRTRHGRPPETPLLDGVRSRSRQRSLCKEQRIFHGLTTASNRRVVLRWFSPPAPNTRPW